MLQDQIRSLVKLAKGKSPTLSKPKYDVANKEEMKAQLKDKMDGTQAEATDKQVQEAEEKLKESEMRLKQVEEKKATKEKDLAFSRELYIKLLRTAFVNRRDSAGNSVLHVSPVKTSL